MSECFYLQTFEGIYFVVAAIKIEACQASGEIDAGWLSGSRNVS
jgi:hypothetical protein